MLYKILLNKHDVDANAMLAKCRLIDITLLYFSVANKQDVDINALLMRFKNNTDSEYESDDEGEDESDYIDYSIVRLYDSIPKEYRNKIDINLLFDVCDSSEVAVLYQLIYEQDHNLLLNTNVDKNKIISKCDNLIKLCKFFILDFNLTKPMLLKIIYSIALAI